MKRPIVIGLILFGLIPLSSIGQDKCGHPTRFKKWYIDVPVDFSGSMTEKRNDGEMIEVTVSAESCDGPFTVLVKKEDGTVKGEYEYERGELVEDKQYIENPEPPYNLEVVIDTVYKTVLIEGP